MKKSLKRNLSLAFSLAVIASILITSIISNIMIFKKFNSYLINEQNSRIKKVVQNIEALYNENTALSAPDEDMINRYASSENLYIQINDSKGNIVFSSVALFSPSGNQMMGMMGEMGASFGPNTIGNYTEESFSIVKSSKNLGTIKIGYYDSSYLTSAAMTFRSTLNHSFFISAIITLITGLIIGLILSKQLSAPLVGITKTANEIRRGNLNSRVKTSSKTLEIKELSDSINYLAETLQTQEMLRKRLTSDMAHEIRTPLTNLKTHVEALIDGVWTPSREIFESFQEEIERLNKLVDNLRDLAKLEEANLNLNKSKFDLSKELEKIVQSFRPLFEKQNISINLNIIPNIIVSMDRDKLKQIMFNLLSNAHKYSKEQDSVFVSLSETNDKIHISISDKGIGIPEKDLPFIFERFYRSDISRDRSTGGSGIGLTIVKSLVEAHGGKIAVKSKINEGTTFTISFPKGNIM